MKRRIFGFQRRVWWPKWTPASSSSAMPTSATGYSLVGDAVMPLGRHGPGVSSCEALTPGRAASLATRVRVSGWDSGYPFRACQRRAQIGGQRRGDLDALAGDWMLEGQARRVQELAVESEQTRGAVLWVAAHRVADRAQVHA